MAQKKTAPYKVLWCIVDRNKISSITDYLNNSEEPVHLSCLAEGTRRLGIFDMLGVGKIDRSVLFGFITAKNIEKILTGLDEILVYNNDKSYGWAFTTDLTSISSESLDYIVGRQKDVKELAKEEERKQAEIEAKKLEKLEAKEKEREEKEQVDTEKKEEVKE